MAITSIVGQVRARVAIVAAMDTAEMPMSFIDP